MDLCVCGHAWIDHMDHRDIGMGEPCIGNDFNCPCYVFKLDHLAYVEKLAKAKGLI